MNIFLGVLGLIFGWSCIVGCRLRYIQKDYPPACYCNMRREHEALRR